MSTTLFFLLPIGVLAVVWSSCFVGCTFPTSGLGVGVGTPYSNTILDEASLIAYWPLNDAMGSAPPPPFPPPPSGSTSIGTATDLTGQHNGSYLLPPIYPLNPPAGSVPIAGVPVVNLQQSSIVYGDEGGGSGDKLPQQAASADFEGGYVSIPWSSPNALSAFTLEAWILPTWNADASGFLRVVFSAFLNNTGFRVLINDMNQLAVVIGNGTPNNMEFALPAAIDLTNVTYIAVTCDMSGNVSLLANGVNDTPMVPQTFPNTGYLPVDPAQPVTFFIGAGENDQPLRTPTTNPDGAPEFPFQGQIQSVALYDSALGTAALQAHFSSGAAT
jgi:hypothetical protein